MLSEVLLSSRLSHQVDTSIEIHFLFLHSQDLFLHSQDTHGLYSMFTYTSN